MRDDKLNDLLKLGATGKSSNNSQSSKRKSFGYQILGFGSGGAGGPICIAFDYLIAGGGGGGSHAHGPGGGGAGGVRTSFSTPCSAITLNTDCGPIAVTIAAGGAKAGSFDGTGSTGGTSSMFNCKPVAIPMGGGGGGGGRRNPGAPSSCGSGGGAGCNHAFPVQAGGNGGSFGNNGAPSQSPCFVGGGGGGACAAATSANGGNGKQISITGSSVNYGCGGGASAHPSGGAGTGGRGDGGDGGNGSDLPTANQAGGGGGNGAPAGATGVVILRFPTACKPAGMSITPGDNTITTTGCCTLLTFTVSGSASF